MRMKRVGAKLAAVAGVATVALTAFAPGAAAATVDGSMAKARFLSGSGGGVSFDKVAALEGAVVRRSGDQGPQKDANALKGSVLGQSLPELPNGLNIPLSQVVELGAVNQYAKVSPDASSVAASGAVADGGAINTTGSQDYPSDATLDLATFLPEQVTKNVADLTLSLGAIGSVAAMDFTKTQEPATTCADLSAPTQCRDYNLATANLTLSLPVLEQVLDQLEPVTDQFRGNKVDVTTLCDKIGAEAGKQAEQLAEALKPLCEQAADNPLIEVEATPPNLDAIVDDVSDVGADQGLTVDLQDGTVEIDLAVFLKSLGLDINNLPPNTELVQYITQALSKKLPEVLQQMVTNLVHDVQSELGKSELDIIVKQPEKRHITLSGDQIEPVLDPVVKQLESAASSLTKQLQGGAEALAQGAEQLAQVLTIHVNVQDSPAEGVYRETAVTIELLKGALPSGAAIPGLAAGNSALELDLARSTVGPVQGTVAKDVPVAQMPPKESPPRDSGPDLPNTGASSLDLPFLLLGLGLVTGGLWVIMYGRSEHSET